MGVTGIFKTSLNYTQAYSTNVVPSHTFVTPTYCGVQTYAGNCTSAGGLPNNLVSHLRQNMASSPDSYNNDGGKDTKKKNTKKRKKKGSEPQRPVSAYALFFRDTQAAIKAENSSATFGEISKIVASMWDSLSEEDKQVYKQKTETAKRDYLKHLAAYRANMISKGTSLEAEEEDSQPLSVLREKIAEQQKVVPHNPVQGNAVIDLTTQESSLPPPPKLHLAPGISGLNQMSEPHVRLQPLPNMTTSIHIPDTQQVTQQQQRPISPGATLTKIIVPGQNGATIHFINKTGVADSHPNVTTLSGMSPVSKPVVIRTVSSNIPGSSHAQSTSPSPIQLRNVINNQQSPITILPSKPGQIIKLVPSESGGVRFASVDANNVKGRIFKIDDFVQSASPIQTIPYTPTLVSPSQEQQTPILQLLADETQPKQIGGTANITDRDVDEDTLMQIPEQNLLPANDISSVMEELAPQPNGDQSVTALPRKCVRDGCSNQAVSCPYWDNEYCSNECVYSHCRDVFDAWVSTRQVTSSAV